MCRSACDPEMISAFLCFCYCRLNDEAKHLISDLGSSVINTLGFRDSWIFVGGKGIRTKSPFEQVIRSAEAMFTFIPQHGLRAVGLPSLRKAQHVRKSPAY